MVRKVVSLRRAFKDEYLRPRSLRIVLNDTFFLNGRWRWEATGRVLCGRGVNRVQARRIASEIQLLIKEFALPIRVVVDHEPKRRANMVACVAAAMRGRQLDENEVVKRINLNRRDSRRLRPGLVILLHPGRVEPFGDRSEKERGVYGFSAPDGVCLLRCYRKEAVRHEFAHMLGLGEHCTNLDCVMNWECRSPSFCHSCLRKIRKICCVQCD